MHEYVFYNSQNISSRKALLRAASAAALYGKGIFSTVAVHNKEPFLWEKHWRRLSENCLKLGVDISGFAEEATLNILAELVGLNGVVNGRARVTFFDESAAGIWSLDTGRKTSLLITTADNRKIPDNFRLTVSPYRVNTMSPLRGVKSCNYLEHLLAFEDAKKRGFDEAIRLNGQGEVTSASMANIFWLKHGKLNTPSLKTGCLAGTTRELILESLDCSEVEASYHELISADDIFLTSAGVGIIQIRELEDWQMRMQPHEILKIVPKPI